ncbi:MAG: right-handed parallel beta-helix repeat-containing protein [Kiritimatiellae bacterium]|nr:right-handed parallel beta-helix repeat-containing protein [Kiritimatiellia bacterium]
MKNIASKIKLAVVAALSCACAVAWAENVLYIHPLSYDSTKSAEAFGTKNYAFADKISTSVSIAIWVKDVTATYEKFLAGVNGRWNLARMHTSSAETNKKLAFRTQSGNTLTDGAVLTDHNWHFIVGTFNYDSANAANSFQRLYVDGTLAAEKTDGIGAITTPDKMFTLGGAATDMSDLGNVSWVDGFNGHFAELSVWNRALSASEVSDLYSQTTRLAGNESGLVAYWPLTGTPGMAAAAYNFTNVVATAGVPNLTRYYASNTDRVAIVDDDGFTKPYVRCVASPEWSEAHSYVQSANATGRSWSDPLTNLVETAAAAKKFERILCSPGTHKIASSISPLVEYFYLGSHDPDTGKPCPETAIIDAQGLCRHFTSTAQTTGHQSGFTVENLTFVNGSAGSGGSMYFRSKTGKINNCIFHGNTATTGQGGAYYALTANGTVVSNCQFYGNCAKASGGGAVYTLQNAEKESDYQRFVDCVFTNNYSSSGQDGGGVCAVRKIELENCLFANNEARGSGVGGHASVGCYSKLRGCVFTGSAIGYYGSCLNIGSVSNVVSNCTFKGMTAGGGEGVIRLKGNGSKFIDCVFTNINNSAPLFYQNSKNILFRQCLIASNASGQAVVDDRSSSATFENCTILQSTFDVKSSGACTNTLVNCILPNAAITSSGNFCNILSNCLVKTVQNGPYDSGVITGNPKFKDAANGDYTLEANSPCRDRGLTLGWMTDGSTDLLDNPRVVDCDGKAFTAAALPDLGCYEIQERKPGFILIVR